MEKRRKNHNKFYFRLAGIICITVMLSFILFAVSYVRRFDRTLMEENEAHLAEIADHIVTYTQSVVADTEASLCLAADTLLQLPESEHTAFLQDTSRRLGFEYMGYAGVDGILHSPEVEKRENISRDEAFLSALEGKSTVGGLERRILKDRVVSGIQMTVPMVADDQPVGALTAILDISRLRAALDIDSFGGAGYSYLIDADGKLVYHNKSMAYNNFFTVLANAEIRSGGDSESIRENMAAGASGMIHYVQLGTEQYAYYCPLGFNSWTVVNIVSREAITAKTNRLTKELVIVDTATVVVFLFLLASAGGLWIFSQNQRHAAEAKSAFLANMSHEIRTPMNAVVGLSEILLREELKDYQKEYVRNILNSGKALLTIINDILDISKIESGKFTIVEEEYETAQLLEDITAITVVRIGGKPVYFLVEADSALPVRMVGDITRVKQILINIIGNAVKFTEKGSITLRLKAAPEREKIRLTMMIEDTGIGIKKQDLGRLFVSFNQVDTHYSHGKEGTGLGLAISKMLSEMMGGGITVESEFGKGSCFTVSVLQGMAGSGSFGASEARPEGNRRILVLEEAEIMQSYFRSCIKKFNIPGDICGTREDFERRLQERQYTHVLADRETVKRLTEAGLPGTEKPVVLLKQRESFIQAEEADGTAVIYAPLFSIQLMDCLSHMGLRRLEGAENREEKAACGNLHTLNHVSILIVDDNELNREIAAGLMEPYGMEIDLASSGREAIDAVMAKEYDLVFLDHMMPEMDGVETLRRIRAIPGAGAGELPVAALTANATSSARQMFKKEGFDDFLAKPIEIHKLEEILERWLRAVNDKRT